MILWVVLLATIVTSLLAVFFAFFLEWIDRKTYARFQHRIGPLVTGPRGILQPIADFIKLMNKEEVTPDEADSLLLTLTPLFALILPLLSFMFIPTFATTGILSYPGDLLFVLILASLYTIMVSLTGFSNPGPFSGIGGSRNAEQFIAYEVSLFLSAISPALLTETINLSTLVMDQMSMSPIRFLISRVALIPGMIVFLLSTLAKIEKVPFDAPEAETELGAGWQTEISGRRLAFFRLSTDLKLLFTSALFVTLFLLGPVGPAIPGFESIFYAIWFVVKVVIVVIILSTVRSILARYRIDQILRAFWNWLIPLALLQVLIVIFLPLLFGW